MHVYISVAYVMFKDNRDNLEFLGLLDGEQFHGKQLRVMPFGFTNVDQNRRFEPFTAQNDACKRFNARYYPNIPINQERYFNSRENVASPADYVTICNK
jgi:hypothetical protein